VTILAWDVEPLYPVEKIQLIWEGIDHAEGLALDDGPIIWAGGEEGQVYRGSLDGSPEEVARLPGRTLGFALDLDGNAFCATIAEAGLYRISQSGAVDLVSRGATDRPAVTPNHPAFLPSGTLLFTDSGNWGKDDGCIFAVSPDGSTHVADVTASRFPNGLAAIDDGRTLVVVESSLPGVSALTVGHDGALGDRRVLARMPGTVPDGIAVDETGRLLVSCWSPDAIFLLDSSGRLELLACDPLRYVLHEPTNIAFVPGTNRLVAANYGERFLSVLEHQAAGAPRPRPRFRWPP
jgi:sugar lactone lactonase YvrE